MECLGIDIGSTSIKGAVLDLVRNEVGPAISVPFPSSVAGLPTGWVEVDPESIFSAFQSLFHSLAQQAPGARSLLLSGQMGGLILVDGQGIARSNYISWRDQRVIHSSESEHSCLHRIRSTWEELGIFDAVGRELQPGSPVALMYWLKERDLLPSDTQPASIADYLIGRLCGTVGPMHATQAIGMIDHSSGDWHRQAFASIGLDHVRLPKLSHCEESIGEFRHAGQSFSVHGSFGDQQCALRGAGVTRDALSINISTGAQVSRLTSAFCPGPYQTRRYFGNDLLNTLTHLPAGRSLNVLVDLLTELSREEGFAPRHPWETIVRHMRHVKKSNLRVDLAFFDGPLGSSGQISGITTDNLSVGSLFLAAFENMADNFLSVSKYLDNPRWTEIVVSGGMTKSVPMLREMIENRFRLPVREARGEETLYGLLDIARSIR